MLTKEVYNIESKSTTDMAATNKDYIKQALLYPSLNDIVKRQACQIEIMKTKNQELTRLVGYLKDIIIELDPGMSQQLELLN